MSGNGDLSRRALLAAMAASPLLLAGARARASARLPGMVVMKDRAAAAAAPGSITSARLASRSR